MNTEVFTETIECEYSSIEKMEEEGDESMEKLEDRATKTPQEFGPLKVGLTPARWCILVALCFP